MKERIAILMGLLLLVTGSPALADIVIEEYENLPPPMVTI